MVQNLIVFVIVAAAVIYMVRKLYLQIKGKAGCDCGCCSKCAEARKAAIKRRELKQKEENTCSCCKKG